MANGSILNRNILLILLTSFFYMSCPIMVNPLIAGFAEYLGAGGAVMGIIGGLMSICSLACRPVVGNLSDRMSKYRLTFIGSVLMLLGCGGYCLSGGTAMLVASRLLHGVGYACCSVCCSTWMASMLPKEKIGSGMGLYGTVNALVTALMPAAGIKLQQLFGYRTAFLIAVFSAILTCVLIQFISDRGEPPVREQQGPFRLQIIEPNVLPIALIMMLFAIPQFAVQSFLVSYSKARELPLEVSLFFPTYAAILLVLRLVLRRYFDTLPYGIFMTGSAVCALAGMICFTTMRTNVGMLAAAAFMAGGYGMMCSVTQANAILRAGPGRSGLGNSTYYAGLDLGMAIGALLGGVLYENLPLTFFFPILALTVPLCFAIYFTMMVRRGRA